MHYNLTSSADDGTVSVSSTSYTVHDAPPLVMSPADEDFTSAYKPHDMRFLALVAHNHMKPALVDFVYANRNLLKFFQVC